MIITSLKSVYIVLWEVTDQFLRSHVFYIAHASSLYGMNRDEVPLSIAIGDSYKVSIFCDPGEFYYRSTAYSRNIVSPFAIKNLCIYLIVARGK